MSAPRPRSRQIDVAGIRTHCLELAGEGTPTLFVHGNPTHSFDWLPFLDRAPGPALAPDLPGFGRSARPDAKSFDYTIESYVAHLRRLLEAAGIDEYRLVVHDWGALALAAALLEPERVRRLVVIGAVPLLAGYRWHWLARVWRTRGAGELANALTSRTALSIALRLARPSRRPMPRAFVDEVWAHYDRATRRAVLRLYRSADPDRLARAGARLGELDCPALVLWGEHDPYMGPGVARAYAEAIPGAELAILDRAGHWPWIDRPDSIDRVTGFLAER